MNSDSPKRLEDNDMSMNAPMRRLAVIVGGAAVIAMGGLTIVGAGNGTGPLGASPVVTPMTTGSPNSYAPTSTNDLMTPVTPPPGSPWRD